jgi:3-hydroxyisobutyrate dehydrogenase-like beta-hydroxyacid dehydrogenase
MTVGFIGLGSLGGPMAGRLIKAGHPVVLWARRPEALAPFAAAGAQTASSIAELGARCDLVGVCVLTDADVRQVCDQLFPAMRPGGLVAIHATTLPDTCLALAKAAAANGLSLIDAPVSGGPHAAEAGALTAMVGGDKADLEAARPVFASFAKLIIHLGDVGAGQRAKLVNNALLAAHLGLAHHALAASTALGIDRAAMIELVKSSTGRSFGFELYAGLPEPAAFLQGALLLTKDVRLLGEVIGETASYAALRDATSPFFELALKGQG